MRNFCESPVPIIVGLVGATGSGKTTLAGLLVDRHNYTRLHIGQPIKDMLSALGVSESDLTGPPAIRSAPHPLLGGRSVRYALSTLGTEWGRNLVSPNLWALATERMIRIELAKGTRKIVIDDLRFPNDFNMIQKNGGIIARINRPGAGRQRKISDIFAHNSNLSRNIFQRLGINFLHESEYYWQNAPAKFNISNDGQIDELLENFFSGLKTLSS